MDEEGCMITEKSFELVECGELESVRKGNKTATKQRDENESSPEKKKITTDSTATRPKKQTKQASILGFFSDNDIASPVSSSENFGELHENEIGRMIFFGSFCLGMLSGFIDESLSKYLSKFYCLYEF